MARPSLFTNRKFVRLSRLLGAKYRAAGVLEMIWSHAYADGNAIIGDPDDVEYIAEWDGSPGDCASALIEAGFLDVTEDGLLAVHDLLDHAPDYVRKRKTREDERRSKSDHDRSLTGHRPPNGSTPTPTPTPTPSTSHACEFEEKFWNRWPTGRKMDRAKCERFFGRLSAKDREAATGPGYQRWLDHWETIERQWVPYPYTWLNNRRWEADPPPAKSKPRNPADTHTPFTDDSEWMYGTYRRSDYEQHRDDPEWTAYTEAAAQYEDETAPTFDEWKAGMEAA